MTIRQQWKTMMPTNQYMHHRYQRRLHSTYHNTVIDSWCEKRSECVEERRDDQEKWAWTSCGLYKWCIEGSSDYGCATMLVKISLLIRAWAYELASRPRKRERDVHEEMNWADWYNCSACLKGLDKENFLPPKSYIQCKSLSEPRWFIQYSRSIISCMSSRFFVDWDQEILVSSEHTWSSRASPNNPSISYFINHAVLQNLTNINSCLQTKKK